MNVDRHAWWGQRRLRYNLFLVVAGLLAFGCYAGILDHFGDRLPNAEITLFTTFFQGVGYLLCMTIANLCYSLGPICERFVATNNVDAYRTYAYAAGAAFSFLLPFLVPALVLMSIPAATPINA